jgi:siroheme synthase
MGASQAQEIADALRSAGVPASTPVAVVENASLAHARTLFTTLGALPNLAAKTLTGPTLILIGAQFRAKAVAASIHDAAQDGESLAPGNPRRAAGRAT